MFELALLTHFTDYERNKISQWHLHDVNLIFMQAKSMCQLHDFFIM